MHLASIDSERSLGSIVCVFGGPAGFRLETAVAFFLSH